MNDAVPCSARLAVVIGGHFVNVKAELVEAVMSAVAPGSSNRVHGNEHCY